MNKGKVIGIIMTYNCAYLVENTFKSLPVGVLDEVFIVDDGSADNIKEIAQKLDITLYTHEHLGYGGNIKYGFKKAIERGADYMVEIHGDGQFDVSFIEPALKKMKEGYDLILATRFIDMRQPLRDHMPLEKYLANIILSFIERLVLRIKVSEFHTGARIYSRKVIEVMNLSHTSNNFLFSFEIIAQIAYYNFKIGEVPTRCYYGQEHSSISFKKSIIYAFASFGVLFYYVLARIGFKTSLFR